MALIRVNKSGGAVNPTLLTVAQGATSFTAEVGKHYILAKNVAEGASVSLTGATVISGDNTITTTASVVHTWAIEATATTVTINGASTGGIVVYQLD